MNDMHDVPLTAFGGVDSAQDQIVLVQQRRTGQIAGRGGRVECQLGEETTSAGKGARDTLQLLNVLDALGRAGVTELEDRLAKASDSGDFVTGRQRVFDTVAQRGAQAFQLIASSLRHARRTV